MLTLFLILTSVGTDLFVGVNGGPSKLIDLTYSFDENTPTFPMGFKFTSEIETTGMNNPFNIWIHSNIFKVSEHAGTHMDAPLHFIEKGQTIDQIPIENLYRVAGMKIDVSDKVKHNPTYAVTEQDMKDWTVEYGPLPDGVVILFQTGFEKKAHNPDLYSGLDGAGRWNIPGIGADAALWMVDYAKNNNQKHGVLGVGLDSLSVDIGNPYTNVAHVILFEKEIYAMENLRNMDQVPAVNFTITMLPMKIGGKGSGAPTRVLVEIDGTPYS